MYCLVRGGRRSCKGYLLIPARSAERETRTNVVSRSCLFVSGFWTIKFSLCEDTVDKQGLDLDKHDILQTLVALGKRQILLIVWRS